MSRPKIMSSVAIVRFSVLEAQEMMSLPSYSRNSIQKPRNKKHEASTLSKM